MLNARIVITQQCWLDDSNMQYIFYCQFYVINMRIII